MELSVTESMMALANSGVRPTYASLWAAAQALDSAEGSGAEHGGRDASSARTESTGDEQEDEEFEDENEQVRASSGATKAAQVKRKGAAGADGPRPRRRRIRNQKPTYLLQKEERDTLVDEARVLEARLELLKLRAGLPTVQDQRSLASVQAANFDIEEQIHANLLRLGRCQDMVSRQIQMTPVNPMRTFIHMPRDMSARQALLQSMKDMKLRRAEELAFQRLHYVDHTKPYMNEERFVDDDGVYHCKRFEIEQFEGIQSVRQVYDALLFFLSNVEISVTETLGHLTIREDVDEFDPTIWNHRIIGKNTGGYTEDMNVVGFTRFDEHYAPRMGAEFGLVACDSVDVDDLYPYLPHERVRKDLSAAHTVSSYRRADTGELVVVLKRCVFVAAYPPQFPLSRSAVAAMREQMTTWAPIVSKLLREKLYGDSMH